MSQAQPPQSHSRSTDPSSPNRRPSSLTSGDQFVLGGPSNPPELSTNAYRKDLADVRLAGRVIASHYAEGVRRQLRAPTELRLTPAVDSDVLASLAEGEMFELLDDARGWAWGYAEATGLVGYIPSDVLVC